MAQYLMWKLNKPECQLSMLRAAAAPTTTLAPVKTSFDCYTDEVWSLDKKAWCCQKEGLGCDAAAAAAKIPVVAAATEPQSAPDIAFVGCYAGGGADPDLADARTSTGTSTACALQCRDHTHMMLHDNGQCNCQDTPPPRFVALPASACGGACAHEDQLTPFRYCGSASSFAVYALSS